MEVFLRHGAASECIEVGDTATVGTLREHAARLFQVKGDFLIRHLGQQGAVLPEGPLSETDIRAGDEIYITESVAAYATRTLGARGLTFPATYIESIAISRAAPTEEEAENLALMWDCNRLPDSAVFTALWRSNGDLAEHLMRMGAKPPQKGTIASILRAGLTADATLRICKLLTDTGGCPDSGNNCWPMILSSPEKIAAPLAELLLGVGWEVPEPYYASVFDLGGAARLKVLQQMRAKGKQQALQGYLARVALQGDAEGARLLIGEGADPNVRLPCGNTLLILACRRLYADVVRVLVGAGADPSARNTYGVTGRDHVKRVRLPALQLSLAAALEGKDPEPRRKKKRRRIVEPDASDDESASGGK